MRGRRAFTLIELCLAMMITAMVATALTTFAFSITQYWRQTEQRQQLQVSVTQSRSVMAPVFESSRGIASVLDGTAPGTKPSVFLWQEDAFGGAADQKAQFAEMSLVEYDASTQTIYLYEAENGTNLLSDLTATMVLTVSDLLNTDLIALFKLQPWLADARPLLGPGRSVDDQREITRVESCSFTLVNSGGLPAVQMNATVSRGQEKRSVIEVFTVQAPTLQ